MGLGKTLMIISLIATNAPKAQVCGAIRAAATVSEHLHMFINGTF
jgi:SNF2 family DNA or RNA helicase